VYLLNINEHKNASDKHTLFLTTSTFHLVSIFVYH